MFNLIRARSRCQIDPTPTVVLRLKCRPEIGCTKLVMKKYLELWYRNVRSLDSFSVELGLTVSKKLIYFSKNNNVTCNNEYGTVFINRVRKLIVSKDDLSYKFFF